MSSKQKNITNFFSFQQEDCLDRKSNSTPLYMQTRATKNLSSSTFISSQETNVFNKITALSPTCSYDKTMKQAQEIFVEIDNSDLNRKYKLDEQSLNNETKSDSESINNLENKLNASFNVTDDSLLSQDSDLQDDELLGEAENLLKSFGISESRQKRLPKRNNGMSPLKFSGSNQSTLVYDSVLQKKKYTFKNLSNILSTNRKRIKRLDLLESTIAENSNPSSSDNDDDPSDSEYDTFDKFSKNNSSVNLMDTTLDASNITELVKTHNNKLVVDSSINSILSSAVGIKTQKNGDLDKAYQIHSEHINEKQEVSFSAFYGFDFLGEPNQSLVNQFDGSCKKKTQSRFLLLSGELGLELSENHLKETLVSIGCNPSSSLDNSFELESALQAISSYITNPLVYAKSFVLSITFLNEIMSAILKNSPTEIFAHIESFEYKHKQSVSIKSGDIQISLDGVIKILELYSQYFECSTRYFLSNTDENLKTSTPTSTTKKKARRRSKKFTQSSINGMTCMEIVRGIMLYVLFILEYRMAPHSSRIKCSLLNIIRAVPSRDWAVVSELWVEELRALLKKMHTSNKILLLSELVASDKRLMITRVELAYLTLLEFYPNSGLPKKPKLIQSVELNTQPILSLRSELEKYLEDLLNILQNSACFNGVSRNTHPTQLPSEPNNISQGLANSTLLLGLKCVSIMLNPSILMPFIQSPNNSNNSFFTFQDKKNAEIPIDPTQNRAQQHLPVALAIHNRLSTIYRRVNKSSAKDLTILRCKDTLHLTLTWMSMTWLHLRDVDPVYSK